MHKSPSCEANWFCR